MAIKKVSLPTTKLVCKKNICKAFRYQNKQYQQYRTEFKKLPVNILDSDCMSLGLLKKMSRRNISPLTETSSTTNSPDIWLLPRHLSWREPTSPPSLPRDKKGTQKQKSNNFQLPTSMAIYQTDISIVYFCLSIIRKFICYYDIK